MGMALKLSNRMSSVLIRTMFGTRLNVLIDFRGSRPCSTRYVPTATPTTATAAVAAISRFRTLWSDQGWA